MFFLNGIWRFLAVIGADRLQCILAVFGGYWTRSFYNMPRRYFRRRIANKDKYSVENTVIITPPADEWDEIEATATTQTSHQFNRAVIPSTDIQGMRKVKHMTLTFSSSVDLRVLYALVYVPEGYNPNLINLPLNGQPGSLYEPNQYVMSAGVLDFSGGPLRIRTPLSRNLNSGDSIYLVLAQTQQDASAPLTVNVQYAITLQ